MSQPPTPQTTQKADSAVHVGRATAPEETRADREAEAATERMGLGYARGATGVDPMGGAPAPTSALHATSGGGRPLPDETRSTMEQGFGRDFSHVRIHDGPAAAEGACAVGSDAFTLGSDIVFADGAYQPESRAGAALLSHELAHTLAPDPEPTIRRGVGFFENVARFFGGGTFSDGELADYLHKLNGQNPTRKPGGDTGAIEGDFDGDNKARAVVEKSLHLDQPVRVRHLLIMEMLDGFVSEADEEAIIQILEDAAKDNLGDAYEIIELVGSEQLQKDLTGKEFDRYMKLIGKVRETDPLPPVPLDWKINYSISGAPNALPGKQGVFLESLGTHTSDGKDIDLASNTSVTTDGQEVATDAPHPRNENGELSVNAAPGSINGDTVTPHATGMQQAKTNYPDISHHYDTVEVLLDLVYGERVEEVKKTATITSGGTTTGTTDAHMEGKSDSKTTGTNKTTGEDKTTGVTVGTSQGAQAGGSVTIKEGEAVRVGKDKKTVDLETKNSEESDVDLETTIDTEESVDLTGETTGTNTRTNDITIDLEGITFDAEVNTAIKGEATADKDKKTWTQKLEEQSESVRRKIIEEVLRRRLGPLSGPATEGIEWIIDKLVGEPPDWTITIDAENKGSVSGSVTGEVKVKWREVEEINQTTETTGTVKKTGTEGTKGKIKSESTGSIKGTEETDRAEVERNRGVEQTVGGSVSVGTKTDVTRSKTKIDRTTNIDEETHGTSSSDTKTEFDLKHDSKSDLEGTDTHKPVAFFQRADLRVRLTGENGRFQTESEPGQRGGGGTERPTQQKGDVK